MRVLEYTPGESATLLLVWQGVCYVSPLISSFVADHVLGRARAVLVWSGPYALGLLLLLLSALPSVWRGQFSARVPALVGLGVVALAQVQVNTLSLGADQFGEGRQAESRKASFFNWIFFAINLGALLAFTLVSWLAQEVSVAAAFAVCLASFLLATTLLALGRGSACCTPSLPPSLSTSSSSSTSTSQACLGLSRIGYREVPPAPVSSLLLSALRLLWASRLHSAPTLLLRAEAAGYSSLEARLLVRVVWALPVLATSVVFWCLWSQTASTFVAQGTVMDLSLGSLTLPVASLNVFNTFVVVLCTPLAERLLYPSLRLRGWVLAPLDRMLAGALVIALAPLYAAVLEVVRRELVAEGATRLQLLGGVEGSVAALSVLWQAPAYILVGLGEVLGAIAGTEYAYAAVPRTHRSTALALYWTASAVGTLLGGLLVATVTQLGGWFAADLNAPHAHLERYFFLLAALGVINTLLLAALRNLAPLEAEEVLQLETTMELLALPSPDTALT